MSDSENEAQQSEEEEPKRPIEEIEKELEEKCWNAFMEYEMNGTGEVLSKNIKHVFASMGIDDDEDEVFRFLSDIDPENTGVVKYSDFKPRIMEREMAKLVGSDDSELLDAYVAMGGEEDGGGCVDADKLIRTIKDEFGMTIDIEKLIEEIDEDGSGEIEFDEFRALLTGDA